jgi:hypothetical protein
VRDETNDEQRVTKKKEEEIGAREKGEEREKTQER